MKLVTMDNAKLSQVIKMSVIKSIIENEKRYFVPVASSNKHIHLSRKDVETLFGQGYVLKPMRPLSQPGQFACEEVLDFMGPKGELKKLRVLGPERKETQVELAVTDCFKTGIAPVVRMSGDLDSTPGGKLVGPAGSVELDHGVIVAMRHLHMSAEQALLYKLKDGDSVRLKAEGIRPVLFEDVIVRAGKGHELEVHIDTDEANAAMIQNGQLLEILR